MQADRGGSILNHISSTRNSFDDSASPRWFATTHWSVVLAAGSDSSPVALEAMERLCRTYWYPLYAYTRRRGFNPHDAEDLVQGFFAKLIEKEMLARVQREGGRFRAFLLACFNHYLNDQRDSAHRVKRGSGREILSLNAELAEGRYALEPAELVDPAKIFERRWALTVLETVLTRLKSELESEGKGPVFEHLQALVVGEPGAARQAEVGARLGLRMAIRLAIRVTSQQSTIGVRCYLWFCRQFACVLQTFAETADLLAGGSVLHAAGQLPQLPRGIASALTPQPQSRVAAPIAIPLAV